MPKPANTILFLCTGNYYRSRFAEGLFNGLIGKMGLPWKATSRALALERGTANVGPMARAAVRALEARGYRGADCDRLPQAVTPADLESAQRVIALQRDEHRPLLVERHPDWADRVEFWDVADAPEALDLIEARVMELVARLLGGGGLGHDAACPRCGRLTCVCQEAKPPDRKPLVARVGRETKGRRGKGVTLVWDLPLDEAGLKDLAARLKNACGTGGTVKDGRIEIQGDQRDRVTDELKKLGYQVKRSGG